MGADQIRKLFGYNSWAWRRVFPSVEELDFETYHAPRQIFGKSSIHQILVHAMSAEFVWWSRCQGESPTALFDPGDYADFTAVHAHWREIIHKWANFVQWLSEEDCLQPVSYYNTRGAAFTLQLIDIMQHVVNHATEHRSQLTPILYNLNAPTPPLDYILYQIRL